MADKKKRFTAVGANIFAGGFTLGVRKFFDVAHHLEHDNYGRETVEHNLKGVNCYPGVEHWPHKLKCDFLYSNPPCAIWSAAGKNSGATWHRDPRLQRVRDIVSLLERYNPKVWCWESVTRAFTMGREFVETIADVGHALGYSSTRLLVDAQYIGAPQVRKLFFLVLHKVQIPWERPSFKDIVTVNEVLSGIDPGEVNQKINKRVMALAKKMKPGEGLNDVWHRLNPDPEKWERTERGHVKGRFSFLEHRIRADRPSPTVVSDCLWHPSSHRKLTMSELQALCGFPQDWKFVGTRPHHLLARGVMPPVGEWVARNVYQGLTLNKRMRGVQKFVVDYRKEPGIEMTLE